MREGRWGERIDLRETSSALPPSAKLKSVSVERISVHLPHTGPLHPAFLFVKWHLRVGHFFIHPKLFTSPLIFSPFTSGDKSCPSSFPVVFKGDGCWRPILYWDYEENKNWFQMYSGLFLTCNFNLINLLCKSSFILLWFFSQKNITCNNIDVLDR